MKKLFTLFTATTLTFGAANAQLVPNGGFENWTQSVGYQDPNNWGSFNVFSTVAPGFPITVSKSGISEAQSGQAAARIETTIGNPDFSQFPQLAGLFPSDTISGALITGSIVPVKIGFPLTARPLGFGMYYKYTSPAADTAIVLLQTFKSNGTSQPDVTGQSLGLLTKNSAYELVGGDINYLNTNPIDSVAIYFFSSKGGATAFGLPEGSAPIPGSVLLVDSVFLIPDPTGVKDVMVKEVDFRMFPNPANDQLSIMCNNYSFYNNTLTLEFFDMTGRKVSTSTLTTPNEKLSVSNLPVGLYTYTLRNSNQVLRVGKFSVAR